MEFALSLKQKKYFALKFERKVEAHFTKVLVGLSKF